MLFNKIGIGRHGRYHAEAVVTDIIAAAQAADTILTDFMLLDRTKATGRLTVGAAWRTVNRMVDDGSIIRETIRTAEGTPQNRYALTSDGLHGDEPQLTEADHTRMITILCGVIEIEQLTQEGPEAYFTGNTAT